MATLTISQIQGAPYVRKSGGLRGAIKQVLFSDGKRYEAYLTDCGVGWDCSLRALPSQRFVASPKRRKLILDYLSLPEMAKQEGGD